MLVIRDDQLEAFRRRDMQVFEAKLTRHLLGKYRRTDPGWASSIVRESIGAAKEYSITEEYGISVIAELMAEKGNGVLKDPAQPQYAGILSDDGLPEQVRIEMLVRLKSWTPPAASEPEVEGE